MKIQLRSGDRVRVISVAPSQDGVRVTLDDGTEATVRVERRTDGMLILERDGRRTAIRAGRPQIRGGDHHLWTRRGTLTYRVEDPAGVGSSAGPGSDLSATIPAVVLEVLVSGGDRVAAGDRLVLLESMKMVMPIVATASGVVREVLCRVGDSVAPGTALVDFLPDSGGSQ